MEHYLILSTLLFLIGLFGIVLNRKNILIILMSIDKGLYFPLFLILTCPIIWYYNNYIICFFYFLIVSAAHSIFLLFYPYVYNSNYYKYLALKTKYFERHRYYTSPFKKVHMLIAKSFLLLSFFWMFFIPEITVLLFPLQIGAIIIVSANTTIDILNILRRPKLPENIRWTHPILQRRYGPITDIVINKVVPLCGRSLGLAGSTYVVVEYGCISTPKRENGNLLE